METSLLWDRTCQGEIISVVPEDRISFISIPIGVLLQVKSHFNRANAASFAGTGNTTWRQESNESVYMLGRFIAPPLISDARTKKSRIEFRVTEFFPSCPSSWRPHSDEVLIEVQQYNDDGHNTSQLNHVKLLSSSEMTFSMNAYKHLVRNFITKCGKGDRVAANHYLLLSSFCVIHSPTASLSISGEALLPSLKLSFSPSTLRLAPSALADSLRDGLLSPGPSSGFLKTLIHNLISLLSPYPGFLTMDERRNVIPLHQSDPHSFEAPLVRFCMLVVVVFG